MITDGWPLRRRERGAVTAEYSVGTIGAAMMAFWLFTLTGRLGDPSSSWYADVIRQLMQKACSFPHPFSGEWVWRWLM